MIAYIISKHHRQNKSIKWMKFHIIDHTTKGTATNYKIELYDLQNAILEATKEMSEFVGIGIIRTYFII